MGRRFGYTKWSFEGKARLTLILEYTEQSGNCMVWKGSKFKSGYGSIEIFGKTKRVHRVVYEAIHGPLKDEYEEVTHICDNPPCINPAHLEKKTHIENMKDMLDRGRYKENSYGRAGKPI
jgi:hypothetical protein